MTIEEKQSLLTTLHSICSKGLLLCREAKLVESCCEDCFRDFESKMNDFSDALHDKMRLCAKLNNWTEILNAIDNSNIKSLINERQLLELRSVVSFRVKDLKDRLNLYMLIVKLDSYCLTLLDKQELKINK